MNEERIRENYDTNLTIRRNYELDEVIPDYELYLPRKLFQEKCEVLWKEREEKGYEKPKRKREVKKRKREVKKRKNTSIIYDKLKEKGEEGVSIEDFSGVSQSNLSNAIRRLRERQGKKITRKIIVKRLDEQNGGDNKKYWFTKYYLNE